MEVELQYWVEKAFQAGFEAGLASALQWHSMDSAPKDGSKFLAINSTKEIFNVFWFDHHSWKGWHTNEVDPFIAKDMKFIAWMPLPPPPTETGEA